MVVVEDAFGPQENNHQGQQQGGIHQQHIDSRTLVWQEREKAQNSQKFYISYLNHQRYIFDISSLSQELFHTEKNLVLK